MEPRAFVHTGSTAASGLGPPPAPIAAGSETGLEDAARGELDAFFLGYGDGLPGLGVPALAGFAGLDLEAAESGQVHFPPGLKGALDRIEKDGISFLGLLVGNSRLMSHARGEVFFSHGIPPWFFC